MNQFQMPVPYDSWIQKVCPAPRRYLQRLAVQLKCKKGVDLGCGENSPLSPLRQLAVWCAGVDASEAMLRSARNRNLFDEYVCADVLEWLRIEVERPGGWEVVVASHIIEHLDRQAGEEVLRLVERIGSRLVYIETPYGFVEPAYEANHLSHHRSGWFPWDFAARGYTVFGMGLRGLRGPRGRPRFRQEFLTRSLERALQWLTYRRPHHASAIAAIRYVDETGRLWKV